MKKVILTRGLPASGKTTWAKQMLKDNPGVYKRINKDDLRAMLDDSKHSKDNEKHVLNVRDLLILEALKIGKNVIIDDTNFSSKHEERIKQLVKGQAVVEIKDFTHIPLEECLERDLKRTDSVGKHVIMRMYNDHLKPKYLPPEGRPKAFIFDVDGTLAKMNGRSPFEWLRVKEDVLNLSVYNIYKALRPHYKIIIFTGRDGVCADLTTEWLEENGIEFDLFKSRPEGDTQKDWIIKRSMFEEIKNDFEICGIFDDRDQVVRMWRSLGLTCFQVDYGNF